MEGKTAKLLNNARLNKETSSITESEMSFADEAESRRVFEELRSNVFKIAKWNEHGVLSSYAIFDKNGQDINGKTISVGVFMRIWLKGSGKYDWVKVIDLFEANDEFVMTVKPTYDPTAEKPDKNVVSHFFTHEATNNFCVVRAAETVKFYVIGLGEKRNTTETDNAVQTARNLAVNLGSLLGVQTGEWKRFTENFLDDAAARG